MQQGSIFKVNPAERWAQELILGKLHKVKGQDETTWGQA